MNRVSVYVTMIILTVSVLLSASSVSAVSPGRAVHGVVRDSANDRVDGANVVVSCNGNILNAVTNSIGLYIVQYANLEDCKKHDLVTVSASKGSEAGSNSKDMGNVQININVRMSAVSVPEFGFTTTLLTIVASATAFIFFKKHVHAA